MRNSPDHRPHRSPRTSRDRPWWTLRRLSIPLIAGLFVSLNARLATSQMPMLAPPAVGSVSLPQGKPDTSPFYQSESTRRMAARLQATFKSTDFRLDPNKASERVTYYTDILRTRKLALPQDSEVRQQLAREMLYAGDPNGALRQLAEVRRRWATAGQTMPPAALKDLGRWTATAYLRLGEQENCATMHGQKACLFPLAKEAVHQLPRGAEGAVREFTALLQADPHDAESRWLLNVAYMQLGRYPHDVPAQWLIPEKQFRSDRPVPAFAEVAASAGIDITSHAGGVAVEDFDEPTGLRRRGRPGLPGTGAPDSNL